MGELVVHDLDVLRPASVIVRLGGKEIDIGFVPSGIAVDVMKLKDELEGLTGSEDKLKEIEEGGDAAIRSFELAADLCATITKSQHAEIDKEWLMKNTDIIQLKALMDLITRSVFQSLQSVEDDETKKP